MSNVHSITLELTKRAAHDVQRARDLHLPQEVISQRFERFSKLWSAALAEQNIGDEELAA